MKSFVTILYKTHKRMKGIIHALFITCKQRSKSLNWPSVKTMSVKYTKGSVLERIRQRIWCNMGLRRDFLASALFSLDKQDEEDEDDDG